MEFNIDDLASLSRISLDEEEKKALKEDLDKILTYVAQINALQLDGVEPLSHVLEMEDVFREDIISEQPEVAKVLDVLPQESKEPPFFKVPKVIESIE